MNSQGPIDISILVATETEFVQAKKVFELEKTDWGWRGCVGSINVRVQKTAELGMPAAACLATQMLIKDNPKLIAMCGVAGGFEGEVTLGSLAVADITWDYTRGKYKNGDFQPEPRQLRLNRHLKETVESREFKKEIQGLRLDWDGGPPPSSSPDIHVGPMAAGGAVVDDNGVLTHIGSQQRKIIALDMESYAVAFAAENTLDASVPWFVVKGISDLAGGNKEQESASQPYCAWLSAKLLYELIKRIDFGAMPAPHRGGIKLSTGTASQVSSNEVIEPRPKVGWTPELLSTLTLYLAKPALATADQLTIQEFSGAEVSDLDEEDAEKARAYNEKMVKYREKVESVRADEQQYIRSKESGQEIRLSLANLGRFPLDDVMVELSFPKSFEVYDTDGLPKKPKLPSRPKKPRFGPRPKPVRTESIPTAEIVSVSGLDIWSPDLLIPPVRQAAEGMYLSNGHPKARVARLMHNHQIDFDEPLIVVPQDKGEFEIEVTVHARNLPDPYVEVLKIVVD